MNKWSPHLLGKFGEGFQRHKQKWMSHCKVSREIFNVMDDRLNEVVNLMNRKKTHADYMWLWT